MTSYQNILSDILHGDRSEEHLPRCFMKIGEKQGLINDLSHVWWALSKGSDVQGYPGDEKKLQMCEVNLSTE